MNHHELNLAKALASSIPALDGLIKKFIYTVLQSENTPVADAYGVQFYAVENDHFRLNATCHRKIVDIEFENAVYYNEDFGSHHLAANVKLFLRLANGERKNIPCQIFMFASGEVHLLRQQVLQVGEMEDEIGKRTLRKDLSELILSAVHRTLPIIQTT